MPRRLAWCVKMPILYQGYCTPEAGSIARKLEHILGIFGYGIDSTWRDQEIYVCLTYRILDPRLFSETPHDNSTKYMRGRRELHGSYRIDYDAFMAATERGRMDILISGLIRATQILDEKYFPADRKQHLIAQMDARRDLVLPECKD
jgi:hypothetical protein